MRILVMMLVVGLVGIVGCHNNTPTPTPTETKKVSVPRETIAKNGDTRNVAVDQQFTVVVVEDPSKDLKWFVDSKLDFVTLVDENKRSESQTRQLRRFTFRATKAGSDTLKFTYRNAWKTDSPAVDTLSIPVVVK